MDFYSKKDCNENKYSCDLIEKVESKTLIIKKSCLQDWMNTLNKESLTEIIGVLSLVVDIKKQDSDDLVSDENEISNNSEFEWEDDEFERLMDDMENNIEEDLSEDATIEDAGKLISDIIMVIFLLYKLETGRELIATDSLLQSLLSKLFLNIVLETMNRDGYLKVVKKPWLTKENSGKYIKGKGQEEDV